MTRDLLQRRRRLDAARLRFGLVDDQPVGLTPEVTDSWRRCATRLPAGHTAPVEPDGLSAAWSDSLIARAASGEVDELARLAVAEDYIAAVTDSAGRILWSAAGPSMGRLAERVNFVTGANWHESAAGTNAPGLCLLTGRPATVFASEHWCEPVQDWVCYAAPVRGPSGLLVGVLDLSCQWRRASPLALTTVAALARLVEQQLRTASAVDPAELRLMLLAHPQAHWHGRPVRLSQRQLEILTILVVKGPVGLDELHELLYGDRAVTNATLKAEVSHLRQLLDGAIESRPYRLTATVEVDLLDVLGALRRGDIEGALRLYQGQLLPASESPFVIDQRHHLDVTLRSALLTAGRTEQLLRFAEVHPFDVEILEVAHRRGERNDPRRGEALARLARAQT